MGLIARSWKRGSPWKEPVPNQNWSFREFENARLELFASSPLVANRHGSLYPGKVRSLERLRALNKFATTKIYFLELLTCEVTFLHICLLTVMKRNCVGRKKKSHIYAQYIREENFAAILVSKWFLKLVLLIIIFFIFFQDIKCVSHYFDAQFLKIASQIWLKQQGGKRRTYHPNSRSKFLKNTCTA